MIPPPPSSTLFPYTTLFRSLLRRGVQRRVGAENGRVQRSAVRVGGVPGPHRLGEGRGADAEVRDLEDQFAVLLRSEEHTSELQSRENLVCRLLLEKKKKQST